MNLNPLKSFEKSKIIDNYFSNLSRKNIKKFNLNMRKSLKFYFKNKRVLVTGHTGFKGSWLSTTLSYLGAKVYGISKIILLIFIKI